jgi:hypothetical protein
MSINKIIAYDARELQESVVSAFFGAKYDQMLRVFGSGDYQ